MNGMITGIIIIVLIRIIVKFIYRNKAEVIVEKDGIPELVPLKNTLVVNHEMDWHVVELARECLRRLEVVYGM